MTAAEPGLSRGLRTPVPCSFPVSRCSAFCEPNQVQELPGAGVGGGRRARNQDSSRGSTRGPPTTGERHEGVTEVRRLLERAGRQPRERDMALRPLEGTAPD